MTRGGSLSAVSRSDCRRLRVAVHVTGVFVAAALVQGAVRPGYDSRQQSISALSLGESGWIQVGFFVLLGFALLSTVPVWRRILAGGIGSSAYPVLMSLTGLSLIVAGLVPQDPAPGYDPELLGRTLPTTTGLIHLAVAGVAAFSSSAALFVMASRFASQPPWRAWAAGTRAAGVLTVASVIIYAVWSTQSTGLAGVFERLVVVIPGIWGYAVMTRLSDGAPFVASRGPEWCADA